jgi:hypothetical protein
LSIDKPQVREVEDEPTRNAPASPQEDARFVAHQLPVYFENRGVIALDRGDPDRHARSFRKLRAKSGGAAAALQIRGIDAFRAWRWRKGRPHCRPRGDISTVGRYFAERPARAQTDDDGQCVSRAFREAARHVGSGRKFDCKPLLATVTKAASGK